MSSGGYTTRKAAFKQLDSASGNLDTCMQHLLNVTVIYEKDHPEIAAQCQGIAKATLTLQEVLTAFRRSF